MKFENGEFVVNHHIKYKEIHGYDEIVKISMSDHKKINHKELFPGFGEDEFYKISSAAHSRTEEYKKGQQKYQKQYRVINKEIISKHKKIYMEQYRLNNKVHITEQKKHYNKNLHHIQFIEMLAPNIQLYEHIVYNNATKNVTYSATFRGQHGIKLPVIEVDE